MNNNNVDISLLDNKQCYLAKMLTKIIVVHTLDGSHFAARLMAIEGNKLYFQNRAGETFIDNLDDIRTAREVI